MEEENSSIRIIDEHLNRYLAVTRDIHGDKDLADRAFSTLKDLLVVEIYFMKRVRQIISDDEMSGFILYLETRLRPIVNQFDSSKASFRTYIRKAVESKALTYMMILRRKVQFDTCYTTHYLPYEGTTVAEEPGPEDYLMLNAPDAPCPLDGIGPTDRLRYICSVRPARQRHIFIFMCTMLPYLEPDTIDSVCSLLNFDSQQTYAIANYLFTIAESENGKRTNKRYMEARYNHFWVKTVEIENAIRMGSTNASLHQMLSYNKAMLQKTREMANTKKQRLSYPQIGKALHLKESTIATAVYESRRLLHLVTQNDIKAKDSLGKLLDAVDTQIKVARAYHFEPFKEFRIDGEILTTPRLNTCLK